MLLRTNYDLTVEMSGNESENMGSDQVSTGEVSDRGNKGETTRKKSGTTSANREEIWEDKGVSDAKTGVSKKKTGKCNELIALLRADDRC